MTWLPLVLAAVSMLTDHKYAGEQGRQRLLEMDSWDASRLRTSYRAGWPRWLYGGLGVLALASMVDGLVSEAWLDAGVSAATAVALGMAVRVRAATAPGVLAVLAERDLPTTERGTSERRTRRMRQLATAAFAAWAVVVLVPLLAPEGQLGRGTVGTVLVVIIVVAVVVGAGAILAMFSAWFWVYGDERPRGD